MSEQEARIARLEFERDSALEALAVTEAAREKPRDEQRAALAIDIREGRL